MMHAQQRPASAMGYLVLFVITVLGLGGYVYTIGPRKPVPEPNKLTTVSLQELMREPGKHHDQFVAIEGWIRYGTFLSDSHKFLYTLHPENPEGLPWSLDGRTNLIIVAKRALDGIDTSEHVWFANDQLAVRFIEEIDFDYAATDATAALITAAS